MDLISAAVATFVPYSPQNITVQISVGASPFVYTAAFQQFVFISTGGNVSISSITKNGQSLTLDLPLTVPLAAGQSLTVTYLQSGSPPVGAPFMIADY